MNNRQSKQRRFWAAVIFAASAGLAFMLYWQLWQPRLSASATPLAAGRIVAGELSSGQSRLYSVSMGAGEFLHLVVEQQDFDVAVEWLDPHGAVLFEVDSPNGLRGPEELWFLARSSAKYHLRIKPPEGSALAGRCQIGIRELRSAKPEDREIAEAFAAFMEGERQRRLGGTEAFGLAAEAYRESLSQWRAAGGRPGQEIICLKRSGEVLSELGESQAALEAFREALALARREGDSWLESILLTDRGQALRKLGDIPIAKASMLLAQQVSQEVGNRWGEYRALNNLAIISRRQGNAEEALSLYDQILPLLKGPNGEMPQHPYELGLTATVLLNKGVAYSYLGRVKEALDALEESLSVFREIDDHKGEADALTEIGWSHYLLGDAEAALPFQEEAVRVCREAEVICPTAATWSKLGSTYRSLGMAEKALEAYQKSLKISQQSQNIRSQANTLVNLGELHVAMGDFQEALEYCRQAGILLDQVEDPNAETHAHYIAARAEAGLNRLPAARTRMEKALEIVERMHSQTDRQILKWTFLASRYLYYDYYLNLLMGMHEEDPSRCLDIVALEAVERTRARALLDRLSETRAEARKAAGEETVQELFQLEKQAAAAERLRRRAASQQEREEADKKLRGLVMQLDDLQARSRAETDNAMPLSEPHTLALPEMQQLLDDNTLLLVYALNEPRSYLWAVSRNSVSSHFLPSRQTIEAAASDFHGLIGKVRRAGIQARADQQAAALSRMLLDPVAEQLGNKRLVVLGDGMLQYLPFAALPTPAAKPGEGPGKRLIIDHELVGLPSASTLATLRSKRLRQEPAACRLAVLADPVFQRTDDRLHLAAPDSAAREAGEGAGLRHLQRLPFTLSEAESILSLLPEEESFQALGFAATREAAISAQVGRCQIVHFATHAVLDSEFPELSRIVLSLVNEQGQPLDGRLRVHEIYGLEMSAQLVVLSACQTALGKDIRGEGLIGLTRGFMYAGVPRLVVSLWNVNDESTQVLMTRFYQRMLREEQPPAAALRAAQIEMLSEEKWRNPYYWAGFVYQGEWLASSLARSAR